MRFSKPSISIPEQLALLKRRGMSVEDDAQALHYLTHVSYYRLRAYWLPFEQPAACQGDHSFIAGTTFEQVVDTYLFDRRLRVLVLDAIERFEVSLRGNWAHTLAQEFGPHGYMEPKHYRTQKYLSGGIEQLEKDVRHSKEVFVHHYLDTYTDPVHLPIWMVAEIVSMGQMSKWIENIKHRRIRTNISSSYNINENVLTSLARHLTYIRNICAHHGRLWNRKFVVVSVIPEFPLELYASLDQGSNKNIYNTLIMLGYLLDKIAPNSGWGERMLNLFGDHPKIDLAAMGFPSDWKERGFWKRSASQLMPKPPSSPAA